MFSFIGFKSRAYRRCSEIKCNSCRPKMEQNTIIMYVSSHVSIRPARSALATRPPIPASATFAYAARAQTLHSIHPNLLFSMQTIFFENARNGFRSLCHGSRGLYLHTHCIPFPQIYFHKTKIRSRLGRNSEEILKVSRLMEAFCGRTAHQTRLN